jgi:signal transduction histidine kinase
VKQNPGIKNKMPTVKIFNSFLHSIRFRLGLWFSSILMLVLIIFSVFIYYIQARDLRRDSLDQLDRRLSTLEQSYFHSFNESEGQVVIPSDFFQEKDIFILVGANNQVIESLGTDSPGDIILQANSNTHGSLSLEDAPARFSSWKGPPGTIYSTYNFSMAESYLENGKSILVILGSPFDILGQLNHLITNLLLGSILTVVIALIGGIWLADRAIRPVLTITQAARKISESDLNYRLNLKGDDELSELANTFDGMLARLQSAFDRQRQFVADASHELRTPLTIINLQTSHALASEQPKEGYKKAFNIIQSENNYMTRMVNDLLLLAKMDNGQAIFDHKPLDLSELLMEAVRNLVPLAENHGVKLEIGDLSEIPFSGDGPALTQMIRNLVENGIKFNNSKDRFVKAESGIEGEWIWLKVSDNGPGISTEHIPHLFDRFYRVDMVRSHDFNDKTGSRLSGGSGLGLSIAQSIAHAHGGEIHVDSEIGIGTCFLIRFRIQEKNSYEPHEQRKH